MICSTSMPPIIDHHDQFGQLYPARTAILGDLRRRIHQLFQLHIVEAED